MSLIKISIILSLFLGVFSCASQGKDFNDKSTNSGSSTNSDKQNQMSFARGLLENYNTSIGNPDTSLAVFLYRNWKNENWEGNIEEYSRWDLEHDKILRLIKSIFNNEPDYEDAIIKLKEKQELFIEYVRGRVQDDYAEYNAVSGMEFEFLVERKDSIIVPLLNKLIANSKAPQDEIEYARSILNSW